MDSFGIQSCDRGVQLQLGRNNLQETKHLCETHLDTKERGAPMFHMASYFLDVMCARNVFTDMNLILHVAELPVHVYFNMHGKTCIRNLIPSSAMNSSPEFILLFLRRNAQGYRCQPIK
jgi:hypothetical protein